MVVTVLIYGVHDDWQRLLLSSSSFIRLHLFLSYCVCLPLNLTRQRDSSTLEAQPRTGNWFPKERKRKTFTTARKDDPIQLTWWQLDVGLAPSSLLLSFFFFFFLFKLEEFSSWFLPSFLPKFIKEKIRPPLRFLVVGCRFSFLQLTSSPLFWKLKKKRR